MCRKSVQSRTGTITKVLDEANGLRRIGRCVKGSVNAVEQFSLTPVALAHLSNDGECALGLEKNGLEQNSAADGIAIAGRLAPLSLFSPPFPCVKRPLGHW